MRLKLLISFAYPYDYSKEIIVAFTIEGQVSRDDERYLFNKHCTTLIHTNLRADHFDKDFARSKHIKLIENGNVSFYTLSNLLFSMVHSVFLYFGVRTLLIHG